MKYDYFPQETWTCEALDKMIDLGSKVDELLFVSSKPEYKTVTGVSTKYGRVESQYDSTLPPDTVYLMNKKDVTP